jgi:hypothetical protein
VGKQNRISYPVLYPPTVSRQASSVSGENKDSYGKLLPVKNVAVGRIEEKGKTARKVVVRSLAG